MLRAILAFLSFTLFVPLISAQTLHSDGYYYYSGYTTPYTRTWVTSYAGGYVNGCYQPSVGYWQYAPYVATATASYANDIDTQMLNIVANREKYLAQVAKSQALHLQIVEKAKLYNLDKSYPFAYSQPIQASAYGIPFGPSYGLTGSYYNTLTPINANTQYGYSYNSIAQLYGDTNLNQLYALSAQLVQGAQQAGTTANTQFNGLVQQAGQNAAKIAEITAKRDFALAMIQNLQATPSVATTGITFSFTPGQVPMPNTNGATADVKAGILKAWGDHAAASCSQCHFGQNIKGGFDLQKYLSMSTEEKQLKVWPRIIPQADPARRMPRNADGSAGQPLTPQQYQLWVMVQPDLPQQK